jgi:hypothetical protein
LLIASCLALAWWAIWLFDPRNLPGLALFVLVVGAQLLDLLATLGFWYAVSPRARPAAPMSPAPGRASILVVAHGQPVQMVEQTLRATAAIRRRHRIFLVDPVARAELRWLPGWYGVTRLTPEMGELAEVAGARFLAVFEAGQVPQPDFLEALLPYFADRGVALVQARYSLSGRRRSRLRDAVFLGGDALGEAPCLGSNYVLRRRALHSIGGFGPAELSLAGSLRLGAALRADGWRTRYVSTQLADGVAVSGPAARLADYCFWAAAEVASALQPGVRPHRTAMAARFYAAWIGTRPFAVLGLAMSVVILAAVWRFGSLSPGWPVNLAMHLVPYLVLRAAVRVVVGAGEASPELSEVLPAPAPKAEPFRAAAPPLTTSHAESPGVRGPEPTLEPAAMAATEPAAMAEAGVPPAVEPWFEPAARAVEPTIPTVSMPERESPDVRGPEPMLEPAAMLEVDIPLAVEPELEPVAMAEADAPQEDERELLQWLEDASAPEAPPELEPAAMAFQQGEEEAAPFASPGDEPQRLLQLPWEVSSSPESGPGWSEPPSSARRRPVASPSAAKSAPSRIGTGPRTGARVVGPATHEPHAASGSVETPQPAGPERPGALAIPQPEAASELESAAKPEGVREPELVWNVLSLLAQEAPVQWTPAAMLLPARRRDRRRASIRRELAVAAAAWIAMAGAIGAAAYAVVQSNPPQHAASVRKVSAPPYSYYAPVPRPSGGAQPGR